MVNALKFHAVVVGKTLPLPDLSAFEGKRVEAFAPGDGRSRCGLTGFENWRCHSLARG